MPLPSTTGLIERPRLNALLHAAFHAPLVLVFAPIGSGKSAAVALALREPATAVAWYGIQAWQRGAFIEPLVNAVREVRPEFGRKTLGIASSAALGSDDRVHAGRLGAAFADDLHHVDEPITIVIDDAHVFGDDERYCAFLDALARALPKSSRLILIGRWAPKFGLADMIVHGSAIALDPAALRFDFQEARTLAQTRARKPDERETRALLERTEGWAVALALGLDTAPHMIPSADGSREALGAYLSEAFINALPEDQRGFLESVAVFETIDARILEDQEPVPNFLRRNMRSLEHRGAPVSCLDGANTFRIHPLLRDALLERIKIERGSAWIATQHRRAAKLYERAELFSPALFHLERADDNPALISFLHAHADDAVGNNELVHIATVVDRLRRTIAENPIFPYIDGLLVRARGGQDAAEAFTKARDVADAADLPELSFAARAKLVTIALGRLDPVPAAELRNLQERAQSLGPTAAALAAVLAGWSSAIAWDFAAARQCVSAYVERGDIGAHFNAAILAAYADTVLGDTAGARRTLDRLLAALEDSDRIVLQTLTLIWYARLALLWGKTGEALDYARAALRTGANLDLRAEEAALALALGEAAIHAGDIEAAQSAIRLASHRANTAWYAGDVRRTHSSMRAIEARIAFLRGDASGAFAIARTAAMVGDVPLAQRALLLADACAFSLAGPAPIEASLFASAAEALAAAVPTDAADALTIIDAWRILVFASTIGGIAEPSQPYFPAFAELLRERAPFPSADPALLEASLAAFTANGPRFESPLITHIIQTRVSAAQVRTPAHPVAAPPGSQLTAREREVLGLLADGLRNKEMAQRLSLSPRTIETHVERVLGKLEAGSRSRAIAIALRLGLIGPLA